jgi:glycosyltransferase involved in cell wall biosynthesis
VADVSVVIPTRDRRDLLRSAIRSVLAQREVTVEVVVVDDGSSDGTEAMVAALGDPRIRVVRDASPLGESAARNRGIDEAGGPWIAFLDDDDLWAPDKLALQLAVLRETGSGWVYGGDVVVDRELNVVSGSPPPPPALVAERLVRYNAIPAGASNVVVSSKLLHRAGPFDPSLRRTADWDMWLRLLRAGPPAAVPKPLVANRVHGGNVSSDMGVLFAELDVIASRHRIPVDRAKHYRWAAWTSLTEGRRSEAARYFAQAVRAGDLPSIGRAAGALLTSRPRPRRRRAAGGDAWTAEASAWLEPFRADAGADARG